MGFVRLRSNIKSSLVQMYNIPCCMESSFILLFVFILEVEVVLQDLENIKVKGKNAPKPIKSWAQVTNYPTCVFLGLC